jgi:hypothetical protein
MNTFKKYKENLSIVSVDGNTFIKSYQTLVAKVDYPNRQIIQLGWWSVTTQKHINYASKELGLELIKNSAQ